MVFDCLWVVVDVLEVVVEFFEVVFGGCRSFLLLVTTFSIVHFANVPSFESCICISILRFAYEPAISFSQDALSCVTDRNFQTSNFLTS